MGLSNKNQDGQPFSGQRRWVGQYASARKRPGFPKNNPKKTVNKRIAIHGTS